MNEERLRKLYQDALAPGSDATATGRTSCVSPEQLLALVRREGTENSRLATLDHVMVCHSCRHEFDLLRAVEQAGVQSGAGPRARWRWHNLAPIGLAASLLLALGVAIGLNRAGERPDQLRGASDGVTLVAPSAQVGADEPITFVWHRVRHANRYVLELLKGGGDGEAVLSRETSDTALVLDPKLIQPGAQYVWWVRAVTSAGELTSPLQPLRVRNR